MSKISYLSINFEKNDEFTLKFLLLSTSQYVVKERDKCMRTNMILALRAVNKGFFFQHSFCALRSTEADV